MNDNDDIDILKTRLTDCHETIAELRAQIERMTCEYAAEDEYIRKLLWPVLGNKVVGMMGQVPTLSGLVELTMVRYRILKEAVNILQKNFTPMKSPTIQEQAKAALDNIVPLT
jgi:hypothetical protein